MNLEDAIYNAAHPYPGGIESLAPRMGLKPTSLRHKVSPTYPTAHLAPREFVVFCTLTGFTSLHALCSELEHIAIPMPGGAENPMVPDLAATLRESGEFVAVTAGAAADGEITRAEMHTIRKEGLDAIASIARSVGAAEGLFGRGKVAPQERRVEV